MANFLASRQLQSSFGHFLPVSSLKASAIFVLILVVAFSLNADIADGAAEGACGNSTGGSKCPFEGHCCSRFDYCGITDDYCGAGCQIAYSNSVGACKAGAPGPSLSPAATDCSSTKKCRDNMCCSQWGHCGTTSDYCYTGCQSQCKRPKKEIVMIALVPIAAFLFLCFVAFIMYKLYLCRQRRKTVKRDIIDPVHRLFPTDIENDEGTSLDIVFCHGFGFGDLEKNAWRNTWRTHDDQGHPVCWAEEWLGSDLEGKARVFSLEYDGNVSSDPSRRSHNTDVSEIANNLLQCLFGDSNAIGQSNAVILIGHSFGGLVIKSLVVEAQRLAVQQNASNAVAKLHAQRCQNFLDNIAGFVFYAVPHSGAQNLDVFIRNCDNMLNWNRGRDNSSGILSNIKEFSRSMEELSVRFESFVRGNHARRDDLIVYAFIEGLPMTQGDLGIIVEHGSAVRLSGSSHYKVESANHMNVCRPKTREDMSYRQLLSVLRVVINENNRLTGNSSQSTPLNMAGHLAANGRSDLEQARINLYDDNSGSEEHFLKVE